MAVTIMKAMFSAMREKGRCSSYFIHIGVSVAVLTSDYDAPDGSPAWETAMVLPVGILCIELVSWNKLVVKAQVNMAARLYKILPSNA